MLVADPTSASQARPIRIAMSAAFVSEAGLHVYDDLSAYLAGKMGKKIEFVTGFGYQTINDMLDAGAIDVAFICGLPYVLLHDRKNSPIELIAAPVMKHQRYNNRPKYFSDLIVRKNSDVRSLADLRGRTYVFNEELSNSGYNMPRYRLLKLGFTEQFFGRVLRSGSHEESIRMVAEGLADASFVDSLVLEYDRDYGGDAANLVRVVESIGPAGIPPVVMSNRVPATLRDEVKRHLLAMHDDPAGRSILDRALIARFVATDDSNYQDIRSMLRTAKKAGYTTIQ